MADEAFATHGTSASVAEAARFSVEGILTKQNGGALLRISEALHSLVVSLVHGLKEFRDVENTLELETAAGIVNGSDEPETSLSVEVRPELLLSVAGALKDMMGILVSDIKVNAEEQKLLPAIQKCSGSNHHAFFQDLMVSKLPSCLVDTSPPGVETPVCISSKDSRRVKRAAVKGQVICKHSCKHHPELVDQRLWRELPQELVELVFAKLPLPPIIHLCGRFKAWSAMSDSSNFSRACSERYPKLVGLLGWDSDYEAIWTTVYDIESRKWLHTELGCFSRKCSSNDESYDYRTDAYKNSMYACDGGLVCFVPQEHLTSSPILVCNPLTNILKTLPLIPLDNFEKQITMVQLVVEDDTKWYRVILVSREKIGRAFSAHFYYSKTGVWSTMDSGLVYGAGSKLKTGRGVPKVFDCTTKVLHDLRGCASLDSIRPFAYSMVKDLLFVLHPPTLHYRPSSKFRVSKYTWESSVSDLRRLRRSDTNVIVSPGYEVMLFASHGSVLVFADNCEAQRENKRNNHHQQIWLYDVSAKQWHNPPPLAECYYITS